MRESWDAIQMLTDVVNGGGAEWKRITAAANIWSEIESVLNCYYYGCCCCCSVIALFFVCCCYSQYSKQKQLKSLRKYLFQQFYLRLCSLINRRKQVQERDSHSLITITCTSEIALVIHYARFDLALCDLCVFLFFFCAFHFMLCTLSALNGLFHLSALNWWWTA